MDKNTHVTRRDLELELSQPLPADFQFGTATSGYQAEGGFNGPDQPKNNWYPHEESGRVARCGDACRFLDYWQEDVQRAAELGCTAFRLGLEWARIQPCADPQHRGPVDFSEQALDLYAEILLGIRKAGMEPHPTLFHFVHPLWAEEDLWLHRESCLPLFADYVHRTVEGLNRRLLKAKSDPLKWIITINEPLMVPFATYLLKIFPGPKDVRGWRPTVTTLENHYLAHVEAVQIIRRLYDEQGWPRPLISTNSWSCCIYELDKMFSDLLRAPAAGIGPGDLDAYLSGQKRRFAERLDAAPLARSGHRVRRHFERRAQWWVTKLLGKAPFGALRDRVLSSEEPLVDELLFDYYDPFLLNYVEPALWPPFKVHAEPWTWACIPEGMSAFFDSYADGSAGAGLGIVENGMGVRNDGSRAYARSDGVTRDRALAAALVEAARAIRKGVKLDRYYYWTLVDNYEWGSFEPRFGLYGVDYKNGARRMDTDAAGIDAGQAYRELIAAMKTGGKVAINAFAKRLGL